jgi:peptidoglycan/xylan/chitin deacetylase (PgdA/CDA1 family)
MLKTAKQALLRTVKAAGLFHAVADSPWRRNRLLILGYHGISLADEHEWNRGLYIQPSVLRQRFEMLRDGGYRVLPLEEGLHRLFGGKLPPRSVAITFDDGAYDFYAAAYPLLREFNFPATLYLSTFYCRYQAPVFDTVCSYILWKGQGRTFDGAGFVPEGGPIAIPNPREALAAYRRIHRYVRAAHLSAEKKEELARELARRLGVDYQAIRQKRMLYLMTPAEVAEAAAGGVSIQLHTHRHRTPLDRQLFIREIRDNIREIQDITGTRPAHFCYPSSHYQPQFGFWLRELGVVSAAAGQTGLASPSSDPLCLPRLLDVEGLSPIEFEGWLTGINTWLPRRKK